VYISHIQHVIENSSFCPTHKSSVSTGFAEQNMPILRILCYNGSLNSQLFWDSHYIASGRPQQKIPFPNNSSIIISVEVFLPRRCIDTAIVLLCACSFLREPVSRAVVWQQTTPAFRRHVTILNRISIFPPHKFVRPSVNTFLWQRAEGESCTACFQWSALHDR
jgi:hypothetical protein